MSQSPPPPSGSHLPPPSGQPRSSGPTGPSQSHVPPPSGPSHSDATPPSPPAPPQPSASVPSPNGEQWHQRGWVRLLTVGVVAFLVGLAIPSAEPAPQAAADAADEIEELHDALEAANADNDELRDEVDDLSGALAEATDELAESAVTAETDDAAEADEAGDAEAANDVEADGDDDGNDSSEDADEAETEPAAAAPDDSATSTAAGTWTVTRLVDGDTIDVRSASGEDERVRIIGIDTPERGECGFSEATDALAAVIGESKVTLVEGGVDDRDRYDRILRYVDVDGVDAGLELIKQGWAISRYDSRDGYGRHLRQDDYIAADEANSHQCGVTNQSGGGSGSTGSSGGPGNSGDSGGRSTGSSSSTDANSEGAVKKSSNDVCHAPGTQHYNRTTNFTGYDTLEACLESGGRLPRG